MESPPPTDDADAPPPRRHPPPRGGRMGLQVYLDDPASLSSSVLLFYDDDFVAIHDLYPKATVHALLLARSPLYYQMHPLQALANADFRARALPRIARLKALVAAELRRRLGRHDDDAADWAAHIRCGVHAVPSMAHLHIHVLSPDMHSPSMRHRKHYNSFNTPFFVQLAAPPPDPAQLRRMRYLDGDLLCWRCGANFGNQFQRLKRHLHDEFEAWKRE